MTGENKGGRKPEGRKAFKVLVAVDFSPSSRRALRMATSHLGRKPDQIVVLHVIDEDFIDKCVDGQIGTRSQIKKTLFTQAKKNLDDCLRTEGLADGPIEKSICEGIPFLEINKKAVATGADMVIMGNRGNSGDMKTIFFGSTTERVLRFMTRPVLCVPVESDRKD